jgi:hypothetical protein
MRRLFWLLGGLLMLGVWPLLAQSSEGAHWRLGHFAIDVPEVDVYLDNTIMLQSVKLSAISGWRDLPVGAHTIAITLAGGTLDRPLLQPFTLNIQANEWVTMALAGRRTDGSLKLHAVLEDMRPISRGLTRLSVFNAFPNNPPLTIRLDNTEIIRRLAYPGTLPEGNDGMESRDILANTYAVTIELSDGRLVKELPNVGLGAGRSYLLVVFGTLDRPFPVLVATEISASGTPIVASTSDAIPVIIPTDTAPANTPVIVIPTATTPATAEMTAEVVATVSTPEATAPATQIAAEPTVTLALQSASGQARVRFGHFAPGTDAFTLYLDNQNIVTLSSEAMILTEYLEISAGEHTLELVLAGESFEQAFLHQTISFVAGQTYTVAAIGSLDIGTFGIMNVVETISGVAGEAQIGFFNAIPDTREIAILRNGSPILRKLAFPLAYAGAGDGYATLNVIPGRYQFEIVEDNNGIFTPLTTLPELRLGGGRYYTVVITGLKDQEGQPYLIFTSYPPSVAVTQPPLTITPTVVGQ